MRLRTSRVPPSLPPLHPSIGAVLPSIIVLILSVSTAAQSRPGQEKAGSTRNPGFTVTVPDPTRPPSMERSGSALLSGKVVVDDGTPLTDAAVIQSICKGHIRAEGYTDQQGGFSIDLGSNAAHGPVSAEENDSGFAPPRPDASSGPDAVASLRDMRECDLRAALPGFTSESINLASKTNETGVADVGVIRLHRMKEVEGFTISVTSAQAPGKAAEEYAKGREEERKGKWSTAKARFAKAVEIYPKYAVAWLELGRMQLQLNDTASAKASFQHSLDADPSLIGPYGELARLALQEKQWQELADRTQQVLKLNAVSFPEFYYFNALADYYLQRFDQAEKSATRGLTVDVQNKVPKLQYILAIVLAQKGDYAGGALHLRNYLRLAPNADNQAIAQKQLEELDRRAASTASPNQ